ncbi:MAG TPA: hypothetical protein HA346_00850 [Thermoplasmata archaeon]|nr:hypothetical protein [Thermoplasmata archaeon]
MAKKLLSCLLCSNSSGNSKFWQRIPEDEAPSTSHGDPEPVGAYLEKDLGYVNYAISI